jgi:hypothetical protein
MLPGWIKLAIDARVHRELFYRLMDDGQLETDCAEFHRAESARFAFGAGKERPGIPMPPILVGDDELESFFERGQKIAQPDKSEPELGELVFLTHDEEFFPGWYELS